MRAVVIVLGLAGCDPALREACAVLADTPAEIEIGQGTSGFEPLQDGDVLPIDLGPQGGWHTYGTLRALGVYPGPATTVDQTTPTLSFTLTADGFTGGYEELPRRLREDPSGSDDALWLVGDLLVLDVLDAAEADGAQAVLRARLTDACGREAADERRVGLAVR